MIGKIAHLADIHIRKLPTRNDEYEHVFNNLFKSLKEENPDKIVVVGDVVHNYIDLGTEQLVLVKKFLNSLAEIAPVVVTMGNHDFRKKNSKRLDAIAAIIKTIDNPKITYYNKTGIYIDDNIRWGVWHHGERNNNPWKTKSGKELLKTKTDDTITIDLFHDPVNGSKSTSGFEMNKKSYYKLKDFKGDFSFFGDIHLQQYFNGGRKAYPGSLIAQDFSEGDDRFHGYLLWDFKNYSEKGEFSVDRISVDNDWSFQNVKLTPFIDFDDIECQIENPTKYMKIRVVWSTLPDTRNKDNERKIIKYLKDEYPTALISHKNEFVEDDIVEVNENITINNIQEQDVQHDIFKEYLEKIGVEENLIDDILKLDDEIASKLELDANTHIEWNIIKFGGVNFMSYEKLDIDWRDMDGLYQISGVNTAGKTTIIKLLSYILYSQTLETKTRVKFGDSRFVNNKLDTDSTEGYVVLEANGEYYGIKRRTDIERKKDGEIKGAPTKVSYYVLSSPDDELKDENSIDVLTEDDKNQTQKKINEIIGSFDNFIRIVLTTSDTLNKILSNDMAEFIDSILFDSGLDVFDRKLTGIKEHQKEVNKKSRVSCNVASNEENIQIMNGKIKTILDINNDINANKLPGIKGKITNGEAYLETLTKKLYQIDPEIVNLNVDNTQGSINTHQSEIMRLNGRKEDLLDAVKSLKESYDEVKLNELIEKKDIHKENEYSLKLDIKNLEQSIREIDHNIEIIRGKIHVLKQDGGKKKQEILNLKNSKTCPTCGQLMTEEHRKHIDDNIKQIETEMFSIAREIKNHDIDIIETHKTQISECEDKITVIRENINKGSHEMEGILKEIGELTNDKNDVIKRKELQNELDQLPIKIQNEELKKSLLEGKIESHNNSVNQIKENIKINKGIDATKERLATLRDEETTLRHAFTNNENEIAQYQDRIKSNLDLIKEFKEQEYQDRVMDTYKKCVHREGIPRQILSNYIIPKINVELENVLSIAPFKVWLDVDDLRPKLAYYNTPHAVIDAIGSSGKERTFASVVLKLALNEINVKSKPTIFLLDEVMGKLSEDSVEEFVQILQIIKGKCKKILMIEHNHNINPDYVLSVNKSEEGISEVSLY